MNLPDPETRERVVIPHPVWPKEAVKVGPDEPHPEFGWELETYESRGAPGNKRWVRVS